MSKETAEQNLSPMGQERQKQWEAIASIGLDGDTMDCTKCKANIRQQMIEEIETDSQFVSYLHGAIEQRIIFESWWQRFKREES